MQESKWVTVKDIQAYFEDKSAKRAREVMAMLPRIEGSPTKALRSEFEAWVEANTVYPAGR